MSNYPKIMKYSKTLKKLREYMDREFNEVKHTTLNPKGLGAIRIHLIPPERKGGDFLPSVAIINGTDIVPINFTWAIMLSELIKHVNVYDGCTIEESHIKEIIEKTTASVKSLIWFYNRKRIKSDIITIYTTFRQIAFHEPVTADIQHLNIGEYAGYMHAPHRMDIMVSAMTKDGKWHCNQKCVHCYAAGQIHSDEAELTTNQWKEILDKLRTAGIPQVTFTGGEPTMREDLFELIEYARWFISRLNTNGIKLTPEYCDELKRAELDSVQITFYSSDAQVHNYLVGSSQYENTVKGIDNALNAGLNISINTPLCTLNKNYNETLKFLHDKGVIYVTCSGLITTGNAENEQSRNLQLSSDEIKAVLKDAVEYCYVNGMEIAFTSPGWVEPEFCEELGISSPTCGACLSNMAITPAGNVVPCQSWLSGDVLGNIMTDRWEDIWNSESCESCRNYAAEMTGKCPLRRYC